MIAIVIPAYKRDFLKETLASIASQTNKNFHLYIGDDNSPEPIREIVELYQDKVPLTYVRFNENLGAKSLIKQWERCIELSNDEPYIWLFSDDDIMPPDAVERFFKTIENNKHENYLYRFNLKAIDRNNNPVYRYKAKPTLETNYKFAINRLNQRYLSSVVEFIFNRTTYEKYKGFVEFPHAWCSDDATWIKFSAESGIYTISGKPVCWRISGENISSDLKYAKNLIPGLYTYTNWLLNFFKPKSTNHLFLNNLMLNIYRQSIQLGSSFSRKDRKQLHQLFVNHFGIIGHYVYFSAWFNFTIRMIKSKLFNHLKNRSK